MIIFCFSKNRCDKSADNLSGIDLTSSSEKSEIRVFCDKAFSRLKGSDRNLPQVRCSIFIFINLTNIWSQAYYVATGGQSSKSSTSRDWCTSCGLASDR